MQEQSGKGEQLWFSHAIEALFVRGLGARLTPEVKDRIVNKHGINLDRMPPAYPIRQVVEACRSILPMLYPRLSEAEGFRQLGVSFMQGYVETLVGKAMVAVLKVIGPRRTLERMQKNFRTGGNYLETRFKVLGPTTCELWINDCTGMPTFYAGMIEEGARMIGTRNLKTSLTPDTGPAWTMLVTWDV
ncbi:MAG: DUF2378 family protein [Archangium sp.]|nr:DUF2378 family protein [Archangium sp.]